MFHAKRSTIHKAELPVDSVFSQPCIVFVHGLNLTKWRPVPDHENARGLNAPALSDSLAFHPPLLCAGARYSPYSLGRHSPPPTRNATGALLEPALVWSACKFREKA